MGALTYLDCLVCLGDPFRCIQHFDICNLVRFDEILAALDGTPGLWCSSRHVHERAGGCISLFPPLYEIHDLYPKGSSIRALKDLSEIPISDIPEFIGIDGQNPVGAPPISFTRQLSENLWLSI